MKVYLHSEASWQTSKPGERPACLFLSPMLRRRCSMVTRMALEAAYQALERAAVPPQEVNVLHLSRLGEITSLMDLLQALVKREPLSPATFSNSVHHTPIGYFSIQAGNQKIGRTLSAGPMTWVMGCVDAFGLLLAHTEPLLLVYSDESLPPEFSCSGTENLPVGAWAFVFSRQAVGA
ncbi:MAG TPA: beta-ketoacyl synthase chain length factor, partial [Fibrobacteraceae bacterium]|nr:beta-ketoacyl synthase chain length factor [Fibrobacteraceae bacterium]